MSTSHAAEVHIRSQMDNNDIHTCAADLQPRLFVVSSVIPAAFSSSSPFVQPSAPLSLVGSCVQASSSFRLSASVRPGAARFVPTSVSMRVRRVYVVSRGERGRIDGGKELGHPSAFRPSRLLSLQARAPRITPLAG